MKLIGLLGGMSPESTIMYYRKINAFSNACLGKHHSSNIMLISVNFNEIVEAIFEDRWDDAAGILIKEAAKLEQAGVDFIAICCNTLHKVLPQIKKEIAKPFLHILDPVGQKIKRHKLKKISLIGTQFTMAENFHKQYLARHYNLECITPDNFQCESINKIIFDELCHGIIKNVSIECLFNIVNSLKERGAEGIILACTELPLLFSEHNFGLPIFDSTDLHARAIVDYAMTESKIMGSYLGASSRGLSAESRKSTKTLDLEDTA